MIPFLFTDLWYHVNAKKNGGTKYEVITSRKFKQAAKREFQDTGAAGGSSGGYLCVRLKMGTRCCLNASIRDNITVFREFPIAEVDRAIELSGLQELIAERGEDYLCGENGSGLSGGEKQRISIARSLLKNRRCFLWMKPPQHWMPKLPVRYPVLSWVLRILQAWLSRTHWMLAC